MGRWPMVPLGEVCTPIKRAVETVSGIAFRQIGVRLWGEGAYERETIDGGSTKYTHLFEMKKNDIVINKIWARNGSVSIVPEELEGTYGSAEFPTFCIDKVKLNPKWFYWVTKTKSFWTQCDEKSQGSSGKNRLKPSKFLEIMIPLPPLEEQLQIVEKLNVIAKKCNNALHLKRRVQEQVFLLVTSAHLGKSQSYCALGDFLDLHEDKKDVHPVGQYPQVGIYGFGKGLFPKESVQGNETKYKHFNRLYQGALVLSQVKGWEGAIAVCPDSLVGYFASPEYRTFRCREGKLHPEYLSHLVATPWFWRQLNTLTRGVGARRERVRPELFLSLQVPMPSYKAQIKLVSVFNKAKDVIGRIGKDEKSFEVLMQASLKRAFLNT